MIGKCHLEMGEHTGAHAMHANIISHNVQLTACIAAADYISDACADARFLTCTPKQMQK